MDLLEGIYSRRSVRKFTAEPVDAGALREILRAGAWAPSGLNNQPWRFVIVRDEGVRREMGACTKYRAIIEGAPACVALFIDREAMYHEVKDYQSMGACALNMLLAAHAMGLGAVWLGEILNRAEDVRAILGLPETLDLMAVLAVGHPASTSHTSTRRSLDELIVKEI